MGKACVTATVVVIILLLAIGAGVYYISSQPRTARFRSEPLIPLQELNPDEGASAKENLPATEQPNAVEDHTDSGTTSREETTALPTTTEAPNDWASADEETTSSPIVVEEITIQPNDTEGSSDFSTTAFEETTILPNTTEEDSAKLLRAFDKLMVLLNGTLILKSEDVRTEANNKSEIAPLPTNATILKEAGLNFDASSFVAETGRLSPFFVRIPQGVVENGTIEAIAIGIKGAKNMFEFPLNNTDLPDSGIAFVRRLWDNSRLYEIQLGMPEEMCHMIADKTCAKFAYMVYTIERHTRHVQAASFEGELSVACGSVCDLHNDSPCASSCAICDNTLVKGFDTPVTMRYNLPPNTTSIEFQFETYTFEDRIRVFEGAELIYDSGCVGDRRREIIQLNGHSSAVRVDVEPNCRNTKDTLWNFQLKCIG